MFADRRQRMNRAFEAVKGVRASVHRHLECLVIVVPADFTFGHLTPRWAAQRGSIRGAMPSSAQQEYLPLFLRGGDIARIFRGRAEVPIVAPHSLTFSLLV